MFKKKEDKLQARINDLLNELEFLSGESDEYAKIADQLNKLYEAKYTRSKPQLSQDVAYSGAINLAGIILILKHEQVHAIASKALPFISKIRM